MAVQEIAYIDPNLCDRSQGCPASYYCPSDAIDLKKSRPKGGRFRLLRQVDSEKCTGCGTCVQVCSHQAIALKEIAGNSNR